MRNWQGLRVVAITAGILCLCQFSYASGLRRTFRANQALDTTSTPTHATLTVNTEVYDDAGWNSDLTVPTKDAVRDKIEALSIVSPFQTTSNVINNSTATDNFTIGSSTNYGKLAISGDTDETQFYVQGIPSQVNPIVLIKQNSTGVNLLNISQDGTMTTGGTGTAFFRLGSGTSSNISFDVAGSFRTVPVALTDASSVAINASLGNTFWVQLKGQPRTLANPTGGAFGQKIVVIISQDGTGSRKIGFGTNYSFGSTITTYDATTTAGMHDNIALIMGVTSWDIVGVDSGHR